MQVQRIKGERILRCMSKTYVAAAALLGSGLAFGYAPFAALAQEPASTQAPYKEIHVDRSCRILLEESDALSGLTEAEVQNDHAICQLEGPQTSYHMEEALRDGVMSRSNVAVREQTYLLQNVTSEPVAFVVEHRLPDAWEIDSDPRPEKIVDGKAFFRVYAAPGQIVRLHEGERHAVAIADGALTE